MMMIDELMKYLFGSVSKVKRILRDKVLHYLEPDFNMFLSFRFYKLGQTLSVRNKDSALDAFYTKLQFIWS